MRALISFSDAFTNVQKTFQFRKIVYKWINRFCYQIITHDNVVGLTVKHSVRQKNVLNSFHDFFKYYYSLYDDKYLLKKKKKIIKY